MANAELFARDPEPVYCNFNVRGSISVKDTPPKKKNQIEGYWRSVWETNNEFNKHVIWLK